MRVIALLFRCGPLALPFLSRFEAREFVAFGLPFVGSLLQPLAEWHSRAFDRRPKVIGVDVGE